MIRPQRSVSTGILALLGCTSLALAHADDIGMLRLNGLIATGIPSSDAADAPITPGERVFTGDFDVVDGTVEGIEPGLFASEGNFLPGTAIYFNIRTSLHIWNGTDFDTQAAARLTMQKDVDFFPGNTRTTPLTDVLVPGFSLTVDSSGGFDSHFDLILKDLLGGDNASTGIYLLELEFYGQHENLGTSLPDWMVLNYGEDEATHDGATDYVQNTYAPAPGAAGLLALAGFAGMRRRR